MGKFRLVEPALRWLDERVNTKRRASWLHDARGPLAAIVGAVDLLVDGAHDEQREWLEAIRASACALLSRIDVRCSVADTGPGGPDRGLQSAATLSPSVTLPGARILVVVEGEERRREWLAALASRGYTPYGAEDALDALRQLTLEAFDAMLIDAALACLDAELLARAIRGRPGVERMRIGMLRRRSVAASFDFAVANPADFSPRDTAPTARALHRPARARARG